MRQLCTVEHIKYICNYNIELFDSILYSTSTILVSQHLKISYFLYDHFHFTYQFYINISPKQLSSVNYYQNKKQQLI